MNSRFPLRVSILGVAMAASSAALALDLPIGYYAQHIDLNANDIAFDRLGGAILATVGSSAGPGLGNTLVRVDPNSGLLLGAEFVGSEPGDIAVSTDGTTAYIAMGGAPLVRRYDVANHAAGATVFLGFQPYAGFHYATEVAVKPGDPDTFAVARQVPASGPFSSTSSVALYSGGSLVGYPSSTSGAGLGLAFSDDATRLYSYESGEFMYGGPSLRALTTVDGYGLMESYNLPGVLSGFGSGMTAANGRLYFSGGQVMDPDAGYPIGRFMPGANDYGYTAPLADVEPSADGIVYGISTTDPYLGGATLSVYDDKTFVPLQRYRVGVAGTIQDMISLDDGRLAIRTTADYYNPAGIYVLSPLSGIAPVPEPGRVALMLAGLVGVASRLAVRRRH